MRPHGTYSIQREGRALVIDIQGSWNLEGYLDFARDFREAAQPLCGEPWGALVDVRQWGLSTPDIEAADHELQLWTLKHNQRWRAFVSDNQVLKQTQIESHAEPVRGQTESRFFTSMADARSWFYQLGLLDAV